MYTQTPASDVGVCCSLYCHFHFAVALYAERWQFQQCNVMCGSVIGAVGMTDTQP